MDPIILKKEELEITDCNGSYIEITRPDSSGLLIGNIAADDRETRDIVTNSDSESDKDVVQDIEDSFSDSEGDNHESDSDNGDVGVVSQVPRPTQNKRRRVADDGAGRNWRDGGFQPSIHNFDPSLSGTNVDLTEESSELDFFETLFSPDLVERIVQQTNSYYKFVTENAEVHAKSRITKWKDTTVGEMYVFLALYMLMAHQKKNAIELYWSTDPLLSTPIFGDIMSVDRFRLILRFLHFSNNNDENARDQVGKLNKIKMVLDSVKEQFSNSLVPFEKICIDESLLLSKGRLSFKQYVHNQRSSSGIKLFVISDVATNYVLNVIVYTGTSTEIIDSGLGVSVDVVLTLMEPYLGKGHTLYVDNLNTGPELFEKLYSEGTNACGMVRKNRTGRPKRSGKLKVGECIEKHTDNMLADVHWFDKREVNMLTTMHSPGMIDTGKKDWKTGKNKKILKCVTSYNQGMGAVYHSAMMFSHVACVARSVKWYKNLFFYLLDLSVFNAHILEKLVKGDRRQLSSFRLELVRLIFKKYCTTTNMSPRAGRPSPGLTPLRLVLRHFPNVIPPTAKKTNPTRQCFVCSNTKKRPSKRRETRYMCTGCNVSLCVSPCFGEYHTMEHL